jgi:hypothetical protein
LQVQAVPSLDVVALVDQIKRFTSVAPFATDPAKLEAELQMRADSLAFIELLLVKGATSPNDSAFLAGQLHTHIQHEKGVLSSKPYIEGHQRALVKRKLKRKREKAQRKLEQAQAAYAEHTKQRRDA